MSKYTTEVRFICENYAGLDESAGYEAVDRIIDSARDKIFDFEYPIFDPTYKPLLEKKILKHYYTREIGAETVGLWKLWLNQKMNEIMPYYNQLYESQLIEFNPMYDVDLTTNYQKVDDGTENKNGGYTNSGGRSGNSSATSSGSNSGSVSRTDDSKNDHWEMFSDTPEGALNGVRTEQYLTTALHTTDDKTGSTSGEVSGSTRSDSGTNNFQEAYSDTNLHNDASAIHNVQDYLQHVGGKTAGTSYSKMLEEYRKTFLNIDMRVIDELKDLFMTLW